MRDDVFDFYRLGFEDCSANPCKDETICLDTKEGFTCICPPWQEDCTRCKISIDFRIFSSENLRF